jgi:adenylate cyclase
MIEPGQKRRLAAILAADVAGYSRLMGQDEAATVQTLTECREVFSQIISAHQGRVVDTAGDSVLATFDSAVESVESAVEIQRELASRNRHLADERRMNFRIGINLGDVIVRDDGTVYGDGVNIAARLESLAEPGGVVVSGTVFDYVDNKIPVSFEFAGAQTVKNITKPVRAYRIVLNRDGSISSFSGPTRTAKPPRRRLVIVGGIALAAAVGIVGWQAMRERKLVSYQRDPVVARAESDRPQLELPLQRTGRRR